MIARHRGAVAGHDERPHTVDVVQSVAPASAEVNSSPWLRQREAAAYLGISVATLARVQPPRHMIGATPRYHRDELDAWVLARRAR